MATIPSNEYEGYTIRRQKTTVKGHEYTRHAVDFGTDSHGKRLRRTFTTEVKAKAAIREHQDRQKADKAKQAILQRKIGEKADHLGTDDLLDAAMGLQLLKGSATLTDAARYYMNHTRPPSGKQTVKGVIAEYMAEAEADGLRPASLQDLQNRLGRFSAAFGSKPIHEIAKGDVHDWSRSKHTAKQNGEPISGLTRKHYLTVVGGLFNFALEQSYIADNPLTKKSRRRRKQHGMEDEGMPEIITVAMVEAIMGSAQEHDPSMIPPLAVGFFAGVRTNELRQLDWSNINLADRRITISPSIAKKRSVPHIDIADNLAAWLAPYRQAAGPVAPIGWAWRYRFDKVREKAKIARWPHNAMRHCYATFYLLKTDDANKTALQLGHRDTSLLFNHYRALATREDAKRFWAIRPKDKTGVIRFAEAKVG
jgi:integrase/ribosomal protein L35